MGKSLNAVDDSDKDSNSLGEPKSIKAEKKPLISTETKPPYVMSKERQQLPPSWEKNVGRLCDVPKEDFKEFAKKMVVTKKKLTEKNPDYRKPFTKCIKCEHVRGCPRAFEEVYTGEEKYNRLKNDPAAIKNNWNIERHLVTKEKARCVYEMEAKRSDKSKMIKDFRAFCSNNPDDLLLKISEAYKIVEDMAIESPSFGKAQNAFYMLTKLYELKHGAKSGSTNIQINQGKDNPSLDIKIIMKEMREEETAKSLEGGANTLDLDKVIDVTPEKKADD